MNEKLQKIKSILEQSDIVWTRYGSETIEELSNKILKALEKSEYD